MSLLRPGITGFFSCTLERELPSVAMRDFTGVLHAAARAVGGAVDELMEASVTPSFHRARVTVGDEERAVLCNRTVAIVAIARWPVEQGCLVFVDDDRLRGAIEADGRFTVATAAELDRELRENDLRALSDADRREVDYWGVTRVGDVIFHWFD